MEFFINLKRHHCFSLTRKTIIAAICAIATSWVMATNSFAVPSVEGEPTGCGADNICNLTCNNDPDCPTEPQDWDNDKGTSNNNTNDSSNNSTLTALDDVIDCDSTQEKDIRAVAWNIVDDWNAFQNKLENDTGINVGNCLENRFTKNGKVKCMNETNCDKDGNCLLGKASPFNQKIKIFDTFMGNIASMPQADRRACYAALLTHEFSHSCDKFGDGVNSAPELREDAAFNYWKDRFPVTSGLDPNNDCGLD